MERVRLTQRAAELLSRVKSERSGALSFTIDGGCCEGTAPHLFENAVVTSAAEKIGDVQDVPVYLQPGIIDAFRDAAVIIDVIDEPLSESMSVETEYGLRFVLR